VLTTDARSTRRNEGVKTIEAELERALFEAGGIAESNYGFLQKVGLAPVQSCALYPR
jgi:hypothetical protein